ncbi:hypothetical protein F4811DRAFT_557591 [Daldinia bambusicola]|nr:hypothetical protein F4811DRAFT_557591 [Daldinia bambusicola]
MANIIGMEERLEAKVQDAKADVRASIEAMLPSLGGIRTGDPLDVVQLRRRARLLEQTMFERRLALILSREGTLDMVRAMGSRFRSSLFDAEAYAARKRQDEAERHLAVLTFEIEASRDHNDELRAQLVRGDGTITTLRLQLRNRVEAHRDADEEAERLKAEVQTLETSKAAVDSELLKLRGEFEEAQLSIKRWDDKIEFEKLRADLRAEKDAVAAKGNQISSLTDKLTLSERCFKTKGLKLEESAKSLESTKAKLKKAQISPNEKEPGLSNLRDRLKKSLDDANSDAVVKDITILNLQRRGTEQEGKICQLRIDVTEKGADVDQLKEQMNDLTAALAHTDFELRSLSAMWTTSVLKCPDWTCRLGRGSRVHYTVDLATEPEWPSDIVELIAKVYRAAAQRVVDHGLLRALTLGLAAAEMLLVGLIATVLDRPVASFEDWFVEAKLTLLRAARPVAST